MNSSSAGPSLRWPWLPPSPFSFPVRWRIDSGGARCCGLPPACSRLSALLAALSENFATLIVARLLSGFGVGAVLITAPMYIAEISPSAWRGRMVSFNQLFIVLGALAAFVSNYFIVRFGGAADWNWRWMLGIGVVPAIPYFFALLAVPESPRWLAMHGQLPAARRVLARLTGTERADRELEAVLESLEHEAARAKPALVGNSQSRAAPRADHRIAGRHPAADHRHQFGVVVCRGDFRTRRRRRQCVVHADGVRRAS